MHTLTRISAALLAGAVLMGVTACSSAQAPTSSPSAAQSEAPAVERPIEQLDGTSVELSSGGKLDITVPADQLIMWSGSSDDGAVANFMAGSGGATTVNPSVTAGQRGSTQITLVNGEQRVVFTVVVK